MSGHMLNRVLNRNKHVMVHIEKYSRSILVVAALLSAFESWLSHIPKMHIGTQVALLLGGTYITFLYKLNFLMLVKLLCFIQFKVLLSVLFCLLWLFEFRLLYNLYGASLIHSSFPVNVEVHVVY